VAIFRTKKADRALALSAENQQRVLFFAPEAR
jgi:hypothetical protein